LSNGYKVRAEGVEQPFRDSVVPNLAKLVDVLPKLNVTGDPELERLTAEVRARSSIPKNSVSERTDS